MKKENNDDDIPELEDCTEDLRCIRGMHNSTGDSEIKVNVIENKDKPYQIKNNNEEFGVGLRKGFFNKKNSTTDKETKQNSIKTHDLTYIKSQPNSTSKEKFIEEVKKEVSTSQNNLQENILNKKDEWMNQELLTKIAKNPNLLKYFMDPRFAEVIQMMQKDPKEAMTKFGHVPEFSYFIKEFSILMADHFNKLAQEKSAQNPILQDKEVNEILQDPKISPIIFKLQTSGRLDMQEISQDEYIAQRIKKLIDKGVLNIQRE